eukprot:SAG31_NODE_3038_length_4759_cov_2.556438_2_plen_86_part_00
MDGRTGALDPSGVSNVTLYHVLPPRVEAAVLCGLPPGLTLTAKERRALDAVHSSATQKEREDRIKVRVVPLYCFPVCSAGHRKTV